MKFITFTLAFLIPAMFAQADDRLDWLKSKPVNKTRVFSSNPLRSVPSGSWTVSSKDSRHRTMTITNRPVSPVKAVENNAQPTESVEATDRKKNDPAKSSALSSLNPEEVSPEDLNNYIAALEEELSKLNSEVFPVVVKPSKHKDRPSIKQLKTDAKLALMTSNKESLKSEFTTKGATMTDSQADAYLARLLKTLKSQD